MSEETREALSKLGGTTKWIDALDTHVRAVAREVRDELGPKETWRVIDGKMCRVVPGAPPQPAPAKCEECGGTVDRHRETWMGTSSRPCSKAQPAKGPAEGMAEPGCDCGGDRPIDRGGPHADNCRVAIRKMLNTPPSGTIHMRRMYVYGAWRLVEVLSRDNNQEHTCDVYCADVVEKRVAEAVTSSGYVPSSEHRRVVAERDNAIEAKDEAIRLYNIQLETAKREFECRMNAAAQLDAALAKVRELQEEAHHLRGQLSSTGEALRICGELRETAERELGEARALIDSFLDSCEVGVTDLMRARSAWRKP